MKDVEAVLRWAAVDLDRAGVKWAVVGGFAVGARSEPRFTRDADMAVSVSSDREAEELVYRLRDQGYEVFALVEHDVAGRLATARLLPPKADEASPVVDLLFASSGIEREIVDAAEPVEIVPGLRLPVARAGHLIALKLLARAEHRPSDQDDLIRLIKIAEDSELELARDSVRLITERGYARDRDLAADLEDALARFRP